jgi:signal transduction histidine kinase
VITTDRIHRLGGFLIRVSLAGGLGMFGLVELLTLYDTPYLFFLLPSLLAVALVLFADAHLPAAAVPVAAISVASSLSLLLLPPADRAPGMAEAGALLILVAWTLRRWDARHGKIATAALVVAQLLLPARLQPGTPILVFEALSIMGLVAAVAVGLYLRSVDVQRRHSLTEVRRGERLELARDLHDFVAHHVTGMVVQAQAAQYIADGDAARHRESFAAIERAGMEALSSMRRLVSVLREDDGGGTRPLGDLEQLVPLVRQFSVGDAYASLYVSAELDADALPPGIGATVHRVVQESLTNIRKHSPSATTVSVSVSMMDKNLEVSVRDDGRRTTRTILGASGGGYGLAGLTERVTALGGALCAGARPEGGWEVVAQIPLPAQSAGSAA